MAQGADWNQVLATIAVVAVPLLAAIVLHEVAHGAVAYACGDPTAAQAGRLTLNPIPHIDPVGTVLLPGALLLAPLLFGTPAFVFGYARPVPINPTRLRNPRRDALLVALAGPGTNLALAAVSACLLAWLPGAPESTSLSAGLREMAVASLAINCVLAVLNLLPIPPLDGGRALTAILPLGPARALARLEGIGLLVVLLVLLNTNLVSGLARPLMALMLRLTS